MHSPATHTLSNAEIARYSRQILVNEIGVTGQERLINAAVLVVGAGGLGSPILQYLAAAGVGTIGIVDYDIVEESNLQRQVIHSEKSIGKNKVDSAIEFIKNLNSTVNAIGHNLLLDSQNVMEIVKNYSVIVDGTDNVATRYLLNDACVFAKKPLVSAGALRMHGQINIYNFENGPCFRCIFPVPPPVESVTNCNEGGVLGVITGIIGSIQALEVIKIILGLEPECKGKMLLFDGLSGFRKIKLRTRNPECAVCGDQPVITSLQDYILFCGSGPDDKVQNLKILESDYRITVQQFASLNLNDYTVLDVRQKSEIDICNFKGSLFIEYKNLHKEISLIKKIQQENNLPICVLCKHGNDSQLAVKLLLENGIQNCFDVIGGLNEYSNQINPTFPKY